MTRWILLLALTLAVGCDVTAPEPGDRIEDLMVTVDVVPYDVPSGLATAVIISVRNETDRTIVLEDRDCRTLDFVVYDSLRQNLIYPGTEPMGCIPPLLEPKWEFDRRLSPNETATMVHYYRTHYYWGTVERIGDPLPPGKYIVLGGIPGEAPGELRHWAGHSLHVK
ncbi:MAG: hypothetical protein R6U63_02320 [Longimicrobiales bacterium]